VKCCTETNHNVDRYDYNHDDGDSGKLKITHENFNVSRIYTSGHCIMIINS